MLVSFFRVGGGIEHFAIMFKLLHVIIPIITGDIILIKIV